MKYLGIDAGKSGGIAVIDGRMVTASPIPATEYEIWELLESLGKSDCYAVIERVTGYIGDRGNPGSAMFKFGRSYGSLIMGLTAARIPFLEVTPRKWQSMFGISPRGKGEDKPSFKRRLREKARQLFPQVQVVTLATCDALLIAEYARRTHARSGQHDDPLSTASSPVEGLHGL